MKKGYLVALALVLSMVFTACGTMGYPTDGDSYGNVSTSRDGTVNGGMGFDMPNTNSMGAGNYNGRT